MTRGPSKKNNDPHHHHLTTEPSSEAGHCSFPPVNAHVSAGESGTSYVDMSEPVKLSQAYYRLRDEMQLKIRRNLAVPHVMPGDHAAEDIDTIHSLIERYGVTFVADRAADIYFNHSTNPEKIYSMKWFDGQRLLKVCEEARAMHGEPAEQDEDED